MKTFFKIALIPFFALMISCKNEKPHHANHDSAIIPKADSNVLKAATWGLFQAILPCADCDGIKTRLFLKPDHTFILEQNYFGVKDTNQHIFYDLGRWEMQDSTVRLQMTSDGPRSFAWKSDKSLQMRDHSGNAFPDSIAGKYLFHYAGTQFTQASPMTVRGIFTRNTQPCQLEICALKQTYKINMAPEQEKMVLSAWQLLSDSAATQAVMQADLLFDTRKADEVKIVKFRNLSNGDDCEQ